MTRILITGKNSFVGGNFQKYSYYREIEEVSLIQNKPSQLDLGNFDVVLHLVAIVHQSKTIAEKEYFRVNHDLCIETAKEAKKSGLKQFIFLSTVKVYGDYNAEIGVWNEHSMCYPDDSYGKSKYAAEIALKELEDENFKVAIVRTPLVYGEDVRANMLSLIKLIERLPILPLGNSNNKRSFTSVKNLVAFIDRIIEKNASGVFIAKDQRDLSTTELVGLLSGYMGRRIRLFTIPKPLIRLGTFIYPKVFDRLFGSFELENKHTLKALDFTPPVSVEEGLKDMIESYLKLKAN